MKCLVKIHQLMQADGPVVSIVDQNPPVSPMSVRISHKIVDDVHHIVILRIKIQDKLFRLDVMV